MRDCVSWVLSSSIMTDGRCCRRLYEDASCDILLTRQPWMQYFPAIPLLISQVSFECLWKCPNYFSPPSLSLSLRWLTDWLFTKCSIAQELQRLLATRDWIIHYFSFKIAALSSHLKLYDWFSAPKWHGRSVTCREPMYLRTFRKMDTVGCRRSSCVHTYKHLHTIDTSAGRPARFVGCLQS